MADKKTLEERQAEMKAALEPADKKEKRTRASLKKKLERIAGPDSQLRVEVIPASATSKDVKNVLARMKTALKSLEGLSPELIEQKIGRLSQMLHLKLQLQVNEALDDINSPDPDTAKNALKAVEVLMPFVTQISELNVKMQIALGLNEGKNKLVPKRQPAGALPASTEDWEKSFGDTLQNRSIQ